MSESTTDKPEFGARPEDLVAFNETMASINDHNDQFSMGKMMFRAIMDHVEEGEHAQELIDAGATPEEAEQTAEFVGTDKLPLSEEEEMARSIVGITNAPVLESTGLTLSPLRETATMHSSKGQQTVGKVRLQLADGSKFTSFLMAVDPEAPDKDFQRNVTDVAQSLASEATHAIANDTDDQVALETLAYAKGIVAGLEHVGLAESPVTERLRSLDEHAQQGDIKEFVLAGNIGLLTDPEEQSFGPAHWQRDATSEFLADHWNEVLNVIKMAKANPKAQALCAELITAAKTSLDYAKAEWSETKAKGLGSHPYGDGFDDVFETVSLELDVLASPDEDTDSK